MRGGGVKGFLNGRSGVDLDMIWERVGLLREESGVVKVRWGFFCCEISPLFWNFDDKFNDGIIWTSDRWV